MKLNYMQKAAGKLIFLASNDSKHLRSIAVLLKENFDGKVVNTY